MLIRGDALSPIDFGALLIFDYTAGYELGSSLAVIEVPPGVHHAEAWSERSDKYYLVIGGTIHFVLDGEQSDLATGDFCLVRRGRRFSYFNEGPAAARLVLVHTPSFDLQAERLVEP